MTPGHDNPQTGPFFIEGAEPGDTVAIHLIKVQPARPYAVSSFGPGFGAIVGTDRVAANGDVCNKIGTYLKALAAKDNGVPFYVALPSPTIDFSVTDGVAEIPIEQRGADEERAEWVTTAVHAGEPVQIGRASCRERV